MESADVVIAGAGIIGLALALDLAAHGLQVIVAERGEVMNESSWAAAGMLAAGDPENPRALRPLSDLSLRKYPAWLARIENLSGSPVPLRTTIALQAIAAHGEGETVSEAELQLLAPGARSQSYLRLEEQSLDPRDLCVALPVAAKAAGVSILENSEILALNAADTRAALRIETTSGSISAAHFVNCAGAWAGSRVLSSKSRSAFPVVPRKGQMAAVRLRGPERLLCVLRTQEIYLVPRGDGRVIIGATVEDSGFDKAVDANAIDALLRAAASLWPPLAQAEIVESWAGLRPASADQLPLIGNSVDPSHPRGWIAAGHFRNGILLAPATAHLLSQRIRGEQPDIDLTPFDPGRFAFADVSSDKPSTAAL